MKREERLIYLKGKALEVIEKIIEDNEASKNKIKAIEYINDEKTISFIFNDNRGVQYSLSEIGYIFEDNFDGLEIFSKCNYMDGFNKILSIQDEIIYL